MITMIVRPIASQAMSNTLSSVNNMSSPCTRRSIPEGPVLAESHYLAAKVTIWKRRGAARLCSTWVY
jgi:hypothetical protein